MPERSPFFNQSIGPSSPEGLNNNHLRTLVATTADIIAIKYLPRKHGDAFLQMGEDLYRTHLPSIDNRIELGNGYFRYNQILNYSSHLTYIHDVLEGGASNLPGSTMAMLIPAAQLQETGKSSNMLMRSIRHNYSLELHNAETVFLTAEEAANFIASDAPQGTYPCAEVVATMRQQGYNLPDKAQLDQRFNHLVALLGCDLKMAAVAHLAQFFKCSTTSSVRMQKARNFFVKYAALFGEDNLAGDIQMVRSLTHLAQTYQGDTKYGAEFTSISSRLHEMLADKEASLKIFGDVYAALGWEPPAIYSPPAPTPKQPLEAIATGPSEVEIVSRQERFVNKCEATTAQWHFNAIAPSDRPKFKGLIRDLVHGYNQADHTIDGMDKRDARQVIGALNRLLQTSQELSTPQAYQWLQDQLAHEHDLHQELKELGSWKLSATPLSFPLARHIHHITEAWPAYKQMLTSWPLPFPARTIAELEAMLHYNSESPPSPTTTAARHIGQTATSHIVPAEMHQAVSAAQILQEIILPPEPTEHDIQQALSHARSIEAKRTTAIQWGRLHDLIRLQRENDGQLFRTEKILGSQAYFIVVLKLDGRTYSIAEPLLVENATYIVEGETWLDILTRTKHGAQVSGAHRLFHTNEKDGPSHFDKICNLLIDIHSRHEE